MIVRLHNLEMSEDQQYLEDLTEELVLELIAGWIEESITGVNGETARLRRGESQLVFDLLDKKFIIEVRDSSKFN